MRKFSLLAVIFVLLSVSLFGCSSDKTPEAQSTESGSNAVEDVVNQSEESTDVSAEETTGEKITQNIPAPQKPQQQDIGKTVIGKIKSVAGNQVTIEVAQMPEDFSMPDMENVTMPEGFTRPEGLLGMFGGSMPEGMTPPEGFDGEMPDFGNMEGFPGGGGMPQFDMGDIELEYTGKTEKYIIPVGVKVGKGDYTSLSKGMVIMLQLDDSNAVSSVMVISQ